MAKSLFSFAPPRARTPEDDYALTGPQPVPTGGSGGAMPVPGFETDLPPGGPPATMPGALTNDPFSQLMTGPDAAPPQTEPSYSPPPVSAPVTAEGYQTAPDAFGYSVPSSDATGGRTLTQDDGIGIGVPPPPPPPPLPTRTLTPDTGGGGPIPLPPGVGVGGDMDNPLTGEPGGIGVGVSTPLVGAGGPPGGLGGGLVPGGGLGGGLQVSGPAGPAGPSKAQSDLWARLNELLNTTKGYNPEDPENRMQLDVQRANSKRSSDRRRASLAERSAVDGTLNTGGFNTGVDAILAGQGTEDAGFEATLAKETLENQREDVKYALTTGGQWMTAEQDLALRDKLGMLNNQIAQQDLALRDKLGTSDLALRDKLGSGDLALRDKLGMLDNDIRGQGLNLQAKLGQGDLQTRLLQLLFGDRQSTDRLGFDYAQLLALLNQNAYTGLLKG